MLRTQQIKIKKGHKMYSYFEDLTFKAKNLYNVGNFYIRQCLTGLKKDKNDLTPNEKEVIEIVNSTIPKLNQLTREYYTKRVVEEILKDEPKEVKQPIKYQYVDKDNSFLGYNLLEGILKITNNVDYNALPGQINQQVLRLLIRDWKSFFKSNKDYKINPDKYKGQPKPPKYAKKNSNKMISLSSQICKIKDKKYLRFPKTKYRLNIGKLGLTEAKIKEVRVIPKFNYFVVEIVFKHEIEKIEPKEKSERILGIDLGINNLATIVNNIGKQPIIIKGKVLKSFNHYYNKKRAYYYSILRDGKNPKEGPFTSKRLENLTNKRNAKIKDYMHKASKIIIDYAVENKIDTIVIGKNINWKDEINIGKVNNQNFVSIPHNKLIEMITYKAEEVGIKIIITEESYTSKASFLDYDKIPTYKKDSKEEYNFSGKRIKRGLYKTKNNLLINADVNGALNIITKVFSDAFGIRDIGSVNLPHILQDSRLGFLKPNPKSCKEKETPTLSVA